jgi:hypothetical protein
MFVKGKVDFRHVQIWLWICLWKWDLILDMFKYDLKYVCQKKSWLYICSNMTLSMFVKGKVDFRYVQIWFWVCLSKEKLILDIFKYDFEYVCQIKTWLQTCSNMTLSIFVKGKINFRHVKI